MALSELLPVLVGPSLVLTTTLVQAVVLPLEGRLPASPGGADYQAYYDPNLNITWAADANMNGIENWDKQITWVEELEIGGIGGWRLPSADANEDGIVIDCWGGGVIGCEDNEMGYLYWEEGISPFTPGPFSNIQSDAYWSGTEYDALGAWDFTFNSGVTGWDSKFLSFFAWPVHDGDVEQLVTITGIWPADAEAGENVSVFIFGDNFTTDGNTKVYFNGIQQYLVAPVSTDMLIVRLVPVTESLFGPVTVTTPYDTETSTQIFGAPLTGLNLTGIWPGDPEIGEWSSIFLFGTEFTTDGTTEVYFNGVRQYLVAPVTSEMLIVRVLGDASLSGPVTVITPAGTVISVEPLIFVPSEPTCDLQCSAPPAGKFCIAGQLRDAENNDAISSESLIKITLYDALQFVNNPTSAPPLAVDSITINSCGQFLAQGVTLPALGLVSIATEDAETGVDEYIPTARLFPVTADSQIDGINLFATRYTTDEKWKISAGAPFGDSSFYEVGAFLPVFLHQGSPVEGVVITVDGSPQVADDYYFSDSASNLRTTIDVNRTSTGTNGAGIIVNSFFTNHSGTGSEPSGCEWPSSLAASIPGVLLVHEMNAVITGTNMSCP